MTEEQKDAVRKMRLSGCGYKMTAMTAIGICPVLCKVIRIFAMQIMTMH